MSPGFRELVAMRLAGKRPPGFVVVTEVDDIARHFRHPHRSMCALIFKPGETYDWRLLHALDVAIVTRLDRAAVAPLCQDLLEIEPRSFAVTYNGEHGAEYDAIIPYGSR